MAASPLFTCDPAASWYDFTYPLSWSSNCEVAQVLSDIPFISVGILVFGVSALFLAIKTASLSSVSLFWSALLSFIAAVLDLGRTLADGVADGHVRVIQAREVLFALSVGFRLLFYWLYVAEPPWNDLSVAATQRFQRFNFLTLEWAYDSHSASWARWGLPGKLIGAGLLVTIIIITALQIVWRVVPQFHQYSNIYATDVVLELLLSFLLLLKLLSNTVSLNSVDNMVVYTFGGCLAPIFGLVVNIAIGVGDLLYFAFSESTVGRLLEAFEVYIIVVFVMVTAFLRHRDTLLSSTPLQGRQCNGVVFTLPEPSRGSAFRVTPPLVETPRMSTIIGVAIQNKESSREVIHRSARRSLNHVSSWLSFRIPRRRSYYEDEEVMLWNTEKARVDPSSSYSGAVDTEPCATNSAEISTQASKAWSELVLNPSANHMPIISTLDAQSTIARSMEGSVHSGQVLHTCRIDNPQKTPLQSGKSSVTVSSTPSLASGAKLGKNIHSSRTSPVYGLGGIRLPISVSDSRVSLDEPLRQQSQLEQTTETLRLLSTETRTKNLTSSNSVLSPELTRSPSIGQRTVCSEVSLSNFPIPPRLMTPVPPLPASIPSSIKRIRGDRRVRLAAARPDLAQDVDTLVPPKSLACLVDIPGSPRFNSVPHTPTGEENESLSAEVRKSSHSEYGTRYNVTSFIGDLATPGRSRQESQEDLKSRCPTENIWSTSASSDTESRRGSARPPEGLPSSPAAAKLSPLACSDTTQHWDDSTGKFGGAVKGAGLPARVSAERTGGARRMFVRRRPPPLALRSLGHTLDHDRGTGVIG